MVLGPWSLIATFFSALVVFFSPRSRSRFRYWQPRQLPVLLEAVACRGWGGGGGPTRVPNKKWCHFHTLVKKIFPEKHKLLIFHFKIKLEIIHSIKITCFITASLSGGPINKEISREVPPPPVLVQKYFF